ncbi:MAG: hypothetical protein K9H84_03110 [Bacteroidales bacterium]|nr:hypothetical protein [Bacteroidales bacterium]
MTEEKSQDFKKKETIYRIIIGILVLVILFMGWQLMQKKTQVETVIIEKENETQKLENELNTLMDQHEQVKNEYSEVSEKLTKKDSVIEAKAKEIERLIARQADYYQIKRKLEYLRNSHQTYVQELDSLYKVNKKLKIENEDIKQKYEETKTEKEQVTEEKEKLKQKVEKGTLLKAYAISVDAIHMGGWTGDKEKLTDKARRLDKIKICFTISENLIAESGEKKLYIRIARPDGKILFKRSEDYFMLNGEKLQYSLTKTIDYQNEEQHHCMYWVKDEHVKDVMEGSYNVAIYIDNQEIGQGKLLLE